MLKPRGRAIDRIRNFVRLEAFGGILLMALAALALLFANSPLTSLYNGFLEIPVKVQVGTLELAKPLLLWINDGLMAIFFLLIGLEVKREFLEGQLSNIRQVVLPGIAAVGGMAVPALIYVSFNRNDPVALNGWAIPAATDIAFALGVLLLLGKRVPEALKIFLLTVAILDDLAAILIIAIFYTVDLSVTALMLAVILIAGMIVMNRLRIRTIAPYAIMGIALWVVVLKSGVHATLAGVAIAFTVPYCPDKSGAPSPVCSLEHRLHPWVAYGILPIFAFANAGLSLADLSFTSLLAPVPLGIILGLAVGKPVGVFIPSWLSIKLGLAKLPANTRWVQLAGVSIMCGIGFTMSLFIASLAFEHGATDYLFADRLAILIASLVSAVLGYLLLRLTSPAESEY